LRSPTPAAQPPFEADIVYLGERRAGRIVAAVKKQFERKYGRDRVARRFPLYEWRRLGVALDKCRGFGSVLDVGVGQGHFINALAGSGWFERIVGIDVRDYSFFHAFHENFERVIMDAEAMTFGDREFDVVVCMEVIEHQPDGKLETMIAELRRVAGRKLILSVPFCEPEPLPRYHRQRFGPERLQELFPTANFTILFKDPIVRVPWIMIEEARSS
jgi:SAM-dependent methyltransferase